MNERLKNLISQFKSKNIDAYLVTKEINVTYLSQFPSSESWLFVPTGNPKKIFYITDFRYVLEAKKGLKGIMLKPYSESFYETVKELAKNLKVKRLGFDDRHLSFAAFKRLQKSCSAFVKLVSVNNLVEKERELKTQLEISLIRKALKLNLEAYRFLKDVIKPGRSEVEVLFELEKFVKSRGAGFSFPPIIASGPNSCFPHAKVSHRKIKNNEIVLVDMGIDIDGYKSDLTRIFFLGKIPRSVYHVETIVRAAQEKAISKIQPGILAHTIDHEARNHIEKNNLGKFFGHSLGHGVGLEIHEAPTVSSKSPAVLKEGMVFTVEPAVYLPYKFGIRIEDMVLVTRNGCEVLSR